jgi:hypothetical protein
MQNDPESKFLKEYDKIKNIEIEIEDIKEKIDEIDIQGFHDQLFSLNNSLLKTKQQLASLAIFTYGMYLNLWVGKELSDSTSPTFLQASEFVKTKAEKAHDRAKNSSDPISVASQLMTDCEEYFRIHNLEPYRGQMIL